MKIVDAIAIDEPIMKDLRKLHFEYFSLKDTFAFILDQHSTDKDFFESNSAQKIKAELFDKFQEYELFKEDLTTKYIPDKYKGEEYSWQANFLDNTLEIFTR